MAPTPKHRTPKHRTKAQAKAKAETETKAKRFTKKDPIIQQYIIVPFEEGNPKVVRLMTNITNHGMTATYFLGPNGIPGLGQAVRAEGRVEEFKYWFNHTKHGKKLSQEKLAAAVNKTSEVEVVTPQTAKKRAKGQKESLKLVKKLTSIVDFNSKSNRKKQREDSKTMKAQAEVMKANTGVADKNEDNTAKLLEYSKPILEAAYVSIVYHVFSSILLYSNQLAVSVVVLCRANGSIELDSSPSDGSNLTRRSSPSDGSNLTGSTASPSSPEERFEPSPTAAAAALVPSADYVFKTPGKRRPAAPASPKFDALFVDADSDEEYEADLGDEAEATGPSLFGRAFNAIKSPFTASKTVRFDNSDDDDDDEFQDADDGADLDAALEVEESDESLVEEDPTPVVTRTTRSRAAKMKAGVAKGAKAVKKALTPPKLRKAKPKASMPKTKKCTTAKQFQKQEKQFEKHLGWKKDAEVEARAQNNIFRADELLDEIAELEEQYNNFLEQHNDFLE